MRIPTEPFTNATLMTMMTMVTMTIMMMTMMSIFSENVYINGGAMSYQFMRVLDTPISKHSM